MAAEIVAAWGVVLPGSVLESTWFLVLTGFVAVNTVVYVTLSVVKAMPRIYFADWLPRRQFRRETRSIFPDGPR